MAASARGKVVYVASAVPGLFSHIKRLLPNAPTVQIDQELFQDGLVTDELKLQIKDAEILVADPPLIGELLYVNDLKLKLVNSTWAGVNVMMSKIDSSLGKPKFNLTRTGEGFGQIMGEYVVGHIIATERRFKETYSKQKEHEWAQKSLKTFRPLTSVNIGILGLGIIGNEVAKMCKCMGMTVTGIKRQDSTSPSSQNVDNYRFIENLADVLPQLDYLCSILPSTPQTRNLLSGDILSHCKTKKPVFINIGRGDVIDEESLVKAIKCEWIGGAILDVFNKEPLPTTSELWDLSNVTITPHVSGPSLPEKVAECFVDNYNRYVKGEQLKYQVDWIKGY
ncbi:glyoxylate/hydroxypyruvate reductase A isoform X1 [Patella vulgata]|uniref:glyoxylate/hydroxypyruvate reductase A isoform X1 n=1 Tax=Patella vulgata TaxID=6465 RepID=UPI00218053E7|nr:glyoxylate/hydroxypyruvate reductase A isoform X1 [Patella vulgata]